MPPGRMGGISCGPCIMGPGGINVRGGDMPGWWSIGPILIGPPRSLYPWKGFPCLSYFGDDLCWCMAMGMFPGTMRGGGGSPGWGAWYGLR